MAYPQAPYAMPGQQPQLPPWAQQPPGMPPPGMGPGGPGMRPGMPPPGMGAPGAPGAAMPPPTGIPGDLTQGTPGGQMAAGAAGALDPTMARNQLGVGSERMQGAKLAQQYKLADALRADAKNQLQGTQAGRVYVAPNVGNLAANVLGQYAAKRQGERADADMEAFQGKVAGSGMANLRRMGLLKPEKDDDYER